MWQAYNVTQHYLTERKNYQAHSEHKSTRICTPLPVTCYQRKILATQFCHWLIRDWISVLKFQRNPRQVLIIYQNINRLNRRYLHVPAFHYLPPYFALIQILALCNNRESFQWKKKQSHDNSISKFFNETRWEKIFGGGQMGVSLSWFVAGARGALTGAFTIFDSCPIKLNQPWMHSPLILPFISLLKTHQWHRTYRSCSSTGAASSTNLSHILLAPLFTKKKIIIMMKKRGKLVINSLQTFIPISNVNGMSKMYCPSFRCIV